VAWLEDNRREFEMTKNISLAMLDPNTLITLLRTGECEFELTEELFDRDQPGHYLRRVKSMSVTIPCVAGPYTGVQATLTSLKSFVRRDATTTRNYVRSPAWAPDDRFVDYLGSAESIAVSQGQRDTGLFQLDFRDDRYLPFELAGTISRWRLRLSPTSNLFDIQTISDVILHLSFTARDGGDALRDKVVALLTPPPSTPRTGMRVFSAKRDFPDGWQAFVAPTSGVRTLTADLSAARLTYAQRDQTVAIGNPLPALNVITVWVVYGRNRLASVPTGHTVATRVLPGASFGTPQALASPAASSSFLAATVAIGPTGTWELQVTSPGAGALASGEYEDVLSVVPWTRSGGTL
jgi:hypothetical protein